jgi:hypothetical protein
VTGYGYYNTTSASAGKGVKIFREPVTVICRSLFYGSSQIAAEAEKNYITA